VKLHGVLSHDRYCKAISSVRIPPTLPE